MRDPTEYDLALADCVNVLASDAIAISIDGPRAEPERRKMIAGAARAQQVAYEQARIAVAAIRPSARQTRFYQPFEGAVILRDGQPWWGMFYAAGAYLANAETARRAQRQLIEIDHRQAFRENDYRDRLALRFAVTEAGHGALAEDRHDALERRAS